MGLLKDKNRGNAWLDTDEHNVIVCVFAVDLVALSSLGEVFREQELQQGEHVMDVVEMIHSLTAMYERLEEEKSILVNIPLCVDMCLNWLLNVYDR